jgi:hypothetical protein
VLSGICPVGAHASVPVAASVRFRGAAGCADVDPNVRGEQVEECPPGVGVDGLRRLHHGFEELDTNGMSELAERCRQAGLESLFLTSMKIYRDDDAGDKADGSGGPGAGGAGGGGSVEIGRRNKSKGNKR